MSKWTSLRRSPRRCIPIYIYIYIYWWKMITYTAQVVKMLSLTNFWFPFHGGSLTLYSSTWTIMALHLLIVWAITWMFVPSDTPSSLLWVGVAKVTLFRGLLQCAYLSYLSFSLKGFGRLHLSVSSSSLTLALASRGQSCFRRGFWAAMISRFLHMRLWALPWASSLVREVDVDC